MSTSTVDARQPLRMEPVLRRFAAPVAANVEAEAKAAQAGRGDLDEKRRLGFPSRGEVVDALRDELGARKPCVSACVCDDLFVIQSLRRPERFHESGLSFCLQPPWVMGPAGLEPATYRL